MSDGDALFTRICRNPKDFARYFVFADWLDEQGKPTEAECWRLLGEFGKYPAYESAEQYLTSYALSRCYWWNTWDEGYDTNDHSVLPSLWLAGMRKLADNHWDSTGYFSREQAFRDAVATYCRAKPKARKSHREWLEEMARK